MRLPEPETIAEIVRSEVAPPAFTVKVRVPLSASFPATTAAVPPLEVATASPASVSTPVLVCARPPVRFSPPAVVEVVPKSTMPAPLAPSTVALEIAPAAPMAIVPAFAVRLPGEFAVPVSVSVPVPVFTSPPAPLIGPANVHEVLPPPIVSVPPLPRTIEPAPENEAIVSTKLPTSKTPPALIVTAAVSLICSEPSRRAVSVPVPSPMVRLPVMASPLVFARRSVPPLTVTVPT